MDEELLTVAQACKALGVSERGLRRVLQVPEMRQQTQVQQRQTSAGRRQMIVIPPELFVILKSHFRDKTIMLADAPEETSKHHYTNGSKVAADIDVTVAWIMVFYERLLGEKDAHIAELQSTLGNEREQFRKSQLSLFSDAGSEEKAEKPKSQRIPEWLKSETGMSGWQVALITSLSASGIVGFVFAHYIVPSVRFLRVIPTAAAFGMPFMGLQFILMYFYMRSAKRGDHITSEAIYSWAELSIWLIFLVFSSVFAYQMAGEDVFMFLLALLIMLYLTPYSVTKIGHRLRTGKWPPTTVNGSYGCLAFIFMIIFMPVMLWWLSH